MKKILYFIVLVLALGGVALERYLQHRRDPSSPVAEGLQVGVRATQGVAADGSLAKFSTVPDFSLTDRSGISVKRDDLKGKVWFADFIYTTCPDTCPMLSSNLSELQAQALPLGEVRFVSFSVDPEHDTPGVLEGYARHLKATDRWYFLTGDKAQVERIAREGFLLGFERTPGLTNGLANGITHSTKIALVDKNGVVRRFYEGTGPKEHDKMLADLKALLKEEAQP